MKLEQLSGCELGRLVNKGEVSPTEVIQYFRKRIEERNPSVNAFTYTKFEDAFAEAGKLEKRLAGREDCGPLAGVPIALKDFLPSGEQRIICSTGRLPLRSGPGTIQAALPAAVLPQLQTA